MNLKLKHITLFIASILFAGCAMETKKATSESYDIIATEEVDAYEAPADAEYEFSNQLVNQKLQDFYDLLALQSEHPEFNKEVSKQLKNFTNDSINKFKNDDFFIIKNIKQIGNVVFVNDSVLKIKLSYDKVSDKTKSTDTINAIITKKQIKVDDKTLISNKIQFSKN
ncbi:hypothetical protein [Winogradskyella marincola]|uniref:Lipoprotein n=1 Tax=Winogradskyella marincola TaxID=3037795 RepID=A0ABT6G496_9FLAO|nr:hypothetical protein [Winogradskyella sp. YYF002]MDG4716871.1 hypothetical protein [Winogradskyella sp. YYF002]